MSAPIKKHGDRLTLARLFAKNEYRVGAEIGVAAGDYAYSICVANPGVKLYCVDAWMEYSGYVDYNAEQMIRNYLKAKELLEPFNVEFIRSYSMVAVGQFDDSELDFVYIDANHEWHHITQDLYYWARKVRKGGIVSGHDYTEELRPDGKCHVKSALMGYTDAFKIDEWYIFSMDDGRADNWYWVKK